MANLDLREANGVTIVDVPGRVTLGESATALREGLRDLTVQGHKKIVLNLANTSFLDSTALGVLVSAFATASSAGGQIKLCNLGKRVNDLLLVTKLYTVFEVFHDEASALRSFDAQAAKA